MRIFLANKTSFPIYRGVFHGILKVAKQRLFFHHREVSVAILPPKQMQTVNRTYRGKDEPTDVLAFDYGEIVLCPAYIKRKYQVKTKQEVMQKMGELFVHGLAHIAGYTHSSPQKEREMKRVEEKVMARALKEKIFNF